MTNWFFPTLCAIGLALLGVIGDYYIKVAGVGDKSLFSRLFFIGLLIYASTAFGWFFVMKHMKLSSLGVIYALSTILFLTLISVFYFNEKINAYEVFGFILAVLSIIILGRFA